MGGPQKRGWTPLVALTLAPLLVFALDLLLRLPLWVTAPYFPWLLAVAWLATPRVAWLGFGAFVLLLLVGMVFSPRVLLSQYPLVAITNRGGFIVVGFMLTAMVVSARRSATTALETNEFNRRRLDHDLNEMKKAETALRRNEREFRGLAENLPDVVARFDRQLRHVYVNRAVERYTGMPAEAFLGKNHVELAMPDELVRLWQEKMRAVFDSGQSQSFEFTYPALDGPRHFECRLVPEPAGDGIVETVLGINREVTDTVRAQEQAQAHLAHLAHVSRLSTIGGLVSEIAHEINQPLHAIVNYAHACTTALDKTPANRKPNLGGWLKQISDQATRAAEIIRRAGRFVRKTPVRRSAIQVNDLVRDCLRLVNFDLRTYHVKLRCDLADPLPPVVADPVQVQQVLVNLVRNAVEAMSETAAAERRLMVRTEVVDGCVQVSIRDNGRGITAEESERLFEPFFTTKPEGMGMGLAVSQSIVEAHSGRLWAESNPDGGVTFYFTLPVGKEELSHVYCHA